MEVSNFRKDRNFKTENNHEASSIVLKQLNTKTIECNEMGTEKFMAGTQDSFLYHQSWAKL